MLISGTAYDTSYLGPIEWAYYGRDVSRYPDRSVMNRLESRRVPLYIVYAELDPPKLRRQSAGLFAGLCREGCPSDVFIRTLADHTHLSEICQSIPPGTPSARTCWPSSAPSRSDPGWGGLKADHSLPGIALKISAERGEGLTRLSCALITDVNNRRVAAEVADLAVASSR